MRVDSLTATAYRGLWFILARLESAIADDTRRFFRVVPEAQILGTLLSDDSYAYSMKNPICILALTSMILSACANPKQKLVDCSKMATLINQGFPDISAATMASPPEATQAADKIDQVTQELGRLDIRDGDIKQLRSEFVNEYQDLSKSLKELATTFAASTTSSTERAQTDFQEAGSKFSKVLDRNERLNQKLSDVCPK